MQLSKYPKLRQFLVPKQHKIQQEWRKYLQNTLVVRTIKHIHHHNEFQIMHDQRLNVQKCSQGLIEIMEANLWDWET